ncbi:hypothetical protein [Micromonospora sp. S4605]|uniref:hypothetical protein n=1 Tax=Micromonospora sp. S4605 TaxID=1420897 RepID=UPI0011B7C8F0|nr:hypothetical protein [Micromonospora sp. S4605]
MTGIRVRRAGRLGLVLFAMVAFGLFMLPWFRGDGGEGTTNGLDLVYVEPALPGTPNPLTQYFLELAPLPAYVGLLLAFTVAVRRRWAWIVAVVVVVLAAVLTAASAAGLLAGVEDYWEPAEVARYRLFALVTAALAVVLLAAAGTLAVGLRHVYHGFVVALLLAFTAFHLVNVAILAGQAVGQRMTLTAWLPAPAYLLAAGCAVLAATGAALAERSEPAATPAPVGQPAVRA